MTARWRRFWAWLHETPDHINPPVSAFLWLAPSMIFIIVVGVALGRTLFAVTAVITLLLWALGIAGWRLRTGRHHHPINEIRDWLSK